MIEYTQKTYYYIPRTFGSNPFTGPYATVPAALSPWTWVSDASDPLPAHHGHLILPPWLPSKALISSARIAVGCDVSGSAADLGVWIDPGGVAYNSTNPPGQELGSDFTRDMSLYEGRFYNQLDIAPYVEFKYPFLFNREAGDKLLLSIHSARNVQYVYCELGFLVPYVV